jgi:hypothetical protein
VWKAHFGDAAELTFPTAAGFGASIATGTVPEPSALTLLLSAVVAVGASLRVRGSPCPERQPTAKKAAKSLLQSAGQRGRIAGNRRAGFSQRGRRSILSIGSN